MLWPTTVQLLLLPDPPDLPTCMCRPDTAPLSARKTLPRPSPAGLLLLVWVAANPDCPGSREYSSSICMHVVSYRLYIYFTPDFTCPVWMYALRGWQAYIHYIYYYISVIYIHTIIIH